MSNQEKILKIVKDFAKEKGINKFFDRFIGMYSNRVIPLGDIDLKDVKNILNIINETFKNEEDKLELKIYILSYLEFYNLTFLINFIKKIPDDINWKSIIIASLSDANAKLIENYSFEKELLHNLLKQKMLQSDFQEIELLFFKDVITRNISDFKENNSICYSLDKANIIKRCIFDGDTSEVQKKLNHFIKSLSSSLLVLESIQVENICLLETVSDMKIIFIGYRNKDLLDKFIPELINLLPEFHNKIKDEDFSILNPFKELKEVDEKMIISFINNFLLSYSLKEKPKLDKINKI